MCQHTTILYCSNEIYDRWFSRFANHNSLFYLHFIRMSFGIEVWSDLWLKLLAHTHTHTQCECEYKCRDVNLTLHVRYELMIYRLLFIIIYMHRISYKTSLLTCARSTKKLSSILVFNRLHNSSSGQNYCSAKSVERIHSPRGMMISNRYIFYIRMCADVALVHRWCLHTAYVCSSECMAESLAIHFEFSSTDFFSLYKCLHALISVWAQ